ncbi:HEAT repeat domain-containing protein [Chloroflexota bacterium]
MIGGKKPKRSWWRRITNTSDAIVRDVSHGRAKVRMDSIEVDGETIAKLISSLEYTDDSVCKDAAHSLAKIAQKNPEVVREAIPKLISLLDHENAHIRGYAAHALGFLGAEDALAPLKKLLNDFYAESDIIVSSKYGGAAGVRPLFVREIAQEAKEMIEKRKMEETDR